MRVHSILLQPWRRTAVLRSFSDVKALLTRFAALRSHAKVPEEIAIPPPGPGWAQPVRTAARARRNAVSAPVGGQQDKTNPQHNQNQSTDRNVANPKIHAAEGRGLQ